MSIKDALRPSQGKKRYLKKRSNLSGEKIWKVMCRVDDRFPLYEVCILHESQSRWELYLISGRKSLVG